jgi:hypothetical protein
MTEPCLFVHWVRASQVRHHFSCLKENLDIIDLLQPCHFSDEQIEAQRSEVTSFRSPSWQAMDYLCSGPGGSCLNRVEEEMPWMAISVQANQPTEEPPHLREESGLTPGPLEMVTPRIMVPVPCLPSLKPTEQQGPEVQRWGERDKYGLWGCPVPSPYLAPPLGVAPLLGQL